MKRFLFILNFLLIVLSLPYLEALNRDYEDWGDPHCFRHLTPAQLKTSELTHELAQFFPATGKLCIATENVKPWKRIFCPNRSIYSGYIDFDYSKYSFHIKRHLEYCKKNPVCKCYWPEYSEGAARISDLAYSLFSDLVSTTALSQLLEDQSEQSNFIKSSELVGLHALTLAFIVKQLHFIDYCNVCRDIKKYAIEKYERRESAEIQDRLEDILDILYDRFYNLYTSCYAKHPNLEIADEIRFMKLIVHDISGLEMLAVTSNLPLYNFSDVRNRKLLGVDSTKRLSPQSDIFLEQGTLFNNLLLHKEAIKALTQAISLNPSSRDAYIERAMAYFETNQLSLALKDYESANGLIVIPLLKQRKALYIPKNKLEFSQGLLNGTAEGAKVSTVEFVPSILSCCRGILNGLWAFASSPVEISQEMLDAAYAVGEFISNHLAEECLQCAIPEIKELSNYWDRINDYNRGEKIGFIIGKYGIDIFLPMGALKGISKVKALKRANTMLTLESCAASEAKCSKILEESARRASIRANILSEAVKNERIVIRNFNTRNHIMQPKHAWDKVIKITGDLENDCKRVVALLEDNKIFLEKYRGEIVIELGFTRYEHQMQINGYNVKAIFNKNPETGDLFLNNAWVVTK